MIDKTLRKLYKGREILIPGGGGFIGSNLAKRLVKYGSRVVIVDSFSEFCGTNICNLKGIEKKVVLIKEKIEDYITRQKSIDYDVIFNCVGLTNHYIGLDNVQIDYNINCYSGLAILQSLKLKKSVSKTISIGSRSQYGRCDSRIVKESHLLDPLDIQTAHKTLLEYYNKIFAFQHGLNLAFVRLTNVYGPGQRLKGQGIGAIGEIIKNSIMGDEIIVYGSLDRGKDILFVDDVVDALLLLGMRQQDGFAIYNLGGGRCHKFSELIDVIGKKLRDVKVKIIPFPSNIKKIDTGDIILDTEKITKETGWKPRTGIKEGMGTTLDYYLKNKEIYL